MITTSSTFDQSSPYHSPIHPFTHSFIQSFTHPFIQSFTHPFIQSFIYPSSCSFIHPFNHPFIHSFITSTIHAILLHPILLSNPPSTRSLPIHPPSTHLPPTFYPYSTHIPPIFHPYSIHPLTGPYCLKRSTSSCSLTLTGNPPMKILRLLFSRLLLPCLHGA